MCEYLVKRFWKIASAMIAFCNVLHGNFVIVKCYDCKKTTPGKNFGITTACFFLLCSKYTNPIYDAKQYWTFQICETHLQPMKVNYFNEWHIFPDRVERKSMELPNVKDKMKESPCYLHFLNKYRHKSTNASTLVHLHMIYCRIRVPLEGHLRRVYHITWFCSST